PAASDIKSLKPAPEPLWPADMSEHVILFALVRVADHFVGFVDPLELFFRGFFLLVSGLEIRMVLAGELAIRFFNVLVGRVAFDFERLVIAGFCHVCHTGMGRNNTGSGVSLIQCVEIALKSTFYLCPLLQTL